MKKLIIISAPPAAGKNYVSDKIATYLGHVAYFDKDALAPLIKCAFKVASMPYDMDSAFHNENIGPAEYETVFELAIEALRYENFVLINAPFTVQIERYQILKDLKEKLNKEGVQLVLVWVTANKELCHKRMIERNLPRDKEKLAHWEEYSSKISYTPPCHLIDVGAVNELLKVDNTNENVLQDSINKVILKLKENCND